MDINLPGLVGRLCPEARGNPDLQARIKEAVMRKSVEMVAALPVAGNAMLAALAESAGTADKALAVMKNLGIPEAAALEGLTSRIRENCPQLALTIDPLEFRGFEYHDGISFSIFAGGARHELGRGGRYQVGGQAATGFTLYVTYLLPLLPEREKRGCVLVPQDTGLDAIRKLQAQGVKTLYALTDDARKEAKILNIPAIYSSKLDKVEEL
jgi:ATP phosphoribosyltransferase regulatory subunit